MPYSIDGQTLNLAKEPQLKDGTMWVPFRSLGEALGGNVDWDPDTRTAILYLDSRIVTAKVGDPVVNMDGTEITLQAAPYVDDGETWIPVRFFNEALAYGITVDLGTNQVDLTSPAV